MTKYAALILCLSALGAGISGAADPPARVTGGADGWGYTFSDSDEVAGPAFGWIDISGTGDVVSLGDDDSSGELPIGFTFSFFGADHTTFNVNSNGAIFFSADEWTSTGGPCLPADLGYTPNPAMIALHWDDMDPSSASSGGVYYETLGSAPDRQLVVMWDAVVPFFASDPLSFELILNESDDSVVFQYLDLTGPVGHELGESSTVGIQEDAIANPGYFLEYGCGSGGGEPTVADGVKNRATRNPTESTKGLQPAAFLQENLAILFKNYNCADLDGGDPAFYTYATTKPGGAVCSATPPVYSWRDASGGTDILGSLGDDTVAGPYAIPFAFNFYGSPVTQLFVAANGVISFSGAAVPATNARIPVADGVDNLIAWFWDDLDPTDPDVTDKHVYLHTLGTAPNREMVISFVNYPVTGATQQSDSLNAQVILQESSYDILVQFDDTLPTTVDLDSSTIGLENSDGTRGYEYRFDGTGGPVFGSPLALKFEAGPLVPVELQALSVE